MAAFRSVGIRPEQYEKLRKLTDLLNKRQPITKEGITVVIRLADVVGYAIDEQIKKHKIK